MRAQMVEKIAEMDDELIVKYLDGEEISIDEMKAGLRRAVIAKPGYTGILRYLAAQ